MDLKHADKFPAIVELYNQSPRLTGREIAKRVNLSFSVVAGILSDLIERKVIKPRKGKGRYVPTQAQMDRICLIRRMAEQEGKTLSEIARHVGTSRQAIDQFVARYMPEWQQPDRTEWVGDLIALYKSGITRRGDLANRLQTSRATVTNTLRTLFADGVLDRGAVREPSAATIAKVKRIHALRMRGTPWYLIAKKFRVNHYNGLHHLYQKYKDKI
jgi:DNA-binding MarR family transcriptional regulator